MEGGFPADELSGDVFLKTIPWGEVPQRTWLRVIELRAVETPITGSHILSLLGRNGASIAVWATRGMIRKIRGYEERREGLKHIYLKYNGMKKSTIHSAMYHDFVLIMY